MQVFAAQKPLFIYKNGNFGCSERWLQPLTDLPMTSTLSSNPFDNASAAPALGNIADWRKSYNLAALDESAAPADPLNLFTRWMDEAVAAKVPEPNSMTLATVASNLRPSTRIVLIKGLDARGLVWFTNYDSRKGHELAGNPYAALQFHWVELERTVRIEGVVEKIDAAESDAYFYSRPMDSRVGAWASPQSEVIESRAALEDRMARFSAEFSAAAAAAATADANAPADTSLIPPRPAHWGGYRLKPDYWQFWQGRRSRLHDRLRYTVSPDTNQPWRLERLAP